MRKSKPSVNETKHDRQRGAAFASGGRTKMFPEQSAGPQKRGITGKNQTPAPGAQSAKGGGKSSVPGKVLTAKGGRTGVRA